MRHRRGSCLEHDRDGRGKNGEYDDDWCGLCGLKNRCSTAELTRQVGGVFRGFRYELPPDGPPTDCAREASSIGHDVERDAPRRGLHGLVIQARCMTERAAGRRRGGAARILPYGGRRSRRPSCSWRTLRLQVPKRALGAERIAERGIARRTRRGPPGSGKGRRSRLADETRCCEYDPHEQCAHAGKQNDLVED